VNLQRLREANLARMRKELTATPPPSNAASNAVQPLPQPGRGSATTPGTGTAAESAGPSAGYAGRVSARIKANTRGYSGPVTGVPAAEVLLNVAPDGRIISRRVVKSSGVEAWDRAVLDAIDRTEVLPRDVDGRVPPQFLFLHKPDDN
jgi:colicin import membrane protein